MWHALIDHAAHTGGMPEQPRTLHVCAPQPLLPTLLQWAQDAGFTVQSSVGDPLRLWLEDERGETGAAAPRSLLQHDLAKPLFGAERWRAWRRVALLLIALLAVQIIAMQVHWGQLRAERSTLREQAAGQLRAAFPNTTTILDAPLQMQRALADLRAHSGQSDPGDFTSLVSAAGLIFADAPVNALAGLEYGQSAERAAGQRGLRIHVSAQAGSSTAQQAEWTQRAAAAGYDLRFENPAEGAAAPVNIVQVRPAEVMAILRAKGPL
jgi:hypothetical protein